MSPVIELCEDSDDNGEWPTTVSALSLLLSRRRLRDKERRKKMSQVIDLCDDSDDSDDNGKWPNTASVPPPPLSRKRPRDKDKEESSHDHHPRNENGPRDKNATCSAQFVVDLELADEMEVVSRVVSPPRRGVIRSERSAKNDAAGKCTLIMKGVEAIEKDADRHAQIADHREPHEGIAAAASYSMNADPEQISRDEGHIKKHSQIVSTSKPPSRASERQWRVSAWDDRLSELADYRNTNGYCNVPQRYIENFKLGLWVTMQRSQYRLHLEGKKSFMTLSRLQELESLGFEWENRLSKLADFCKIHGHCDVTRSSIESLNLAYWVSHQRKQYMLHQVGKPSQITLPRIQELESLSFEWRKKGHQRNQALTMTRRVFGRGPWSQWSIRTASRRFQW